MYKLNVNGTARLKDQEGNDIIEDDLSLIKNEAYTEDGILFNSEFLNNLKVNEAIEKSHFLVQFPSEYSLNVAVAGSIVLYDRSRNKPKI